MSILKEIKNQINHHHQRAKDNLKKRWWLILPIFLLVLGLGLYPTIMKTSCILFNDQSNYFTANVFYIDGIKPVCMSLEEYDLKFLDGELFECLNAKAEYTDPFECQEVSIFSKGNIYNGS